MNVKTIALVPSIDEEILLRAFRGCSHDNQEHLFWLTLALSKRNKAPSKSAEVVLLADPLRKLP